VLLTLALKKTVDDLQEGFLFGRRQRFNSAYSSYYP